MFYSWVFLILSWVLSWSVSLFSFHYRCKALRILPYLPSDWLCRSGSCQIDLNDHSRIYFLVYPQGSRLFRSLLYIWFHFLPGLRHYLISVCLLGDWFASRMVRMIEGWASSFLGTQFNEGLTANILNLSQKVFLWISILITISISQK